MSKNVEEKKISIEEYEQKYTHPENIAAAKGFLFIFAAAIGLIVAACLFFIVLRLFDIHKYAGYAGIPVAVFMFIVIYLVPVIKIKNTKAFMTNVDRTSARKAQRYNRALRRDIADKMIDVVSKTDEVTWYSGEKVGKLAIARHNGDDKLLKDTLTEIYKDDVRKAANKMIKDASIKVGIATGISQSDKVDTLFITAYELKLIKDVVFLYGYRPSDAKLARIYKNVIMNALIAYGFNSVADAVGKGASKALSSAVAAIPFLGKAVGTVIDSSIQGAINASLTVVIGFQTKKYLAQEYKLQDMLDGIELPIELEEEAEMINEVKDEFSKKPAKKEAVAA